MTSCPEFLTFPLIHMMQNRQIGTGTPLTSDLGSPELGGRGLSPSGKRIAVEKSYFTIFPKTNGFMTGDRVYGAKVRNASMRHDRLAR